MRILKTLALTMALALSVAPSMAQELTIGRGNEPQSIDPQFSRTGPNQMTALHMFDRLTTTETSR